MGPVSELSRRVLIGFFLIYLVIQTVLHFVPWLGGVASFVIGPALLMGNFIVTAKLIQGRIPQFSDFFLGLRFFVPLLLTALVGGVLTGIGFLLLIIPGVYLLVGYLFAPPWSSIAASISGRPWS